MSDDLVKDIGKKGLEKLPKSKIPKSPMELAKLIVETHVKNRKMGGPILLTKVEHEDHYYYGVMSSVDSTWWKVDMEGHNCKCNAKATEDQCQHELAIIIALAEDIPIPTYEDLLNDDKTNDDVRRSVHNGF